MSFDEFIKKDTRSIINTISTINNFNTELRRNLAINKARIPYVSRKFKTLLNMMEQLKDSKRLVKKCQLKLIWLLRPCNKYPQSTSAVWIWDYGYHLPANGS